MRLLHFSLFLFFSLWISIFGSESSAQTQTDSLYAEADRQFKRVVFYDGEDSLLYRFYAPPGIEHDSLPLLIFLHGAGERGTGNKISLKHLSAAVMKDDFQKKYPCFILVPQCPKGKRWAEVSWSLDEHRMPAEMSDPLRMTVKLHDSLLKSLPVLRNRIYLTGLSMGGFGTWDWAMREPEGFAAIAPVCGGADQQQAEKLKALPIWVFHGSDDRVVKPERSRRMYTKLKAYGNIRYTEYPGVGHGSWKPAYASDDFWKWLFEQKR